MSDGVVDVGGYGGKPKEKIITDIEIMGVRLLAGDRADNESSKQVVWCNEFLRMGLKRTVSGLYYLMHKESVESFGDDEKFPTLATIRGWSQLFQWSVRSELYDSITESHRQRQMWLVAQSELIQSWGRVLKLIQLEERLNELLDARGPEGDLINLWVKHKGSVSFNQGLVSQYRGILDDIAKEVGGRKREANVEVMFGSPEDSVPSIDPSKLSDEDLLMFATLMEKADLNGGEGDNEDDDNDDLVLEG